MAKLFILTFFILSLCAAARTESASKEVKEPEDGRQRHHARHPKMQHNSARERKHLQHLREEMLKRHQEHLKNQREHLQSHTREALKFLLQRFKSRTRSPTRETEKPVMKTTTTTTTTTTPKLSTTKRHIVGRDDKFDRWWTQWQKEVSHCGDPEVEPLLKGLRVMGGSTARKGSWPWMASLFMSMANQHWCGGTLISDQWVLTSPHCLLMSPRHSQPSAWEIKLGKFNTTSGVQEDSEQNFGIDYWIIHPGFEVEKLFPPKGTQAEPPANDLALLKLNGTVKRTQWVQPVCLPQSEQILADHELCAITGWGSTTSPPEWTFPNILQEAVVPVFDYKACSNFEGYARLLTKDMICAGYTAGKIDTCAFDSGGPLQCMFDGKWYLTGSTSWGDAGGQGCGKPRRPGVYTKIANYVEWIYGVIYDDYQQSQK